MYKIANGKVVFDCFWEVKRLLSEFFIWTEYYLEKITTTQCMFLVV